MCNTLTCPVEGIDAGASPALTTDANYHPIIAYVERTVVSTVGSCATGPCQCQAAARARARAREHGGATGPLAFRFVDFGLFESFTAVPLNRNSYRRGALERGTGSCGDLAAAAKRRGARRGRDRAWQGRCPAVRHTASPSTGIADVRSAVIC